MQPNDKKSNQALVTKTLDALESLNQDLAKAGQVNRYMTLPYEVGSHALDERARIMGYEPLGLDIKFDDPDNPEKQSVPMIVVTLPEELNEYNDGIYSFFVDVQPDGSEKTMLGVIIPNSKSREKLVHGIVESLDNHMASLKHPDLQPYDYLQIMYQFIEHSMVNAIATKTFPEDATIRRLFSMEYSPQVFLALAMYASGKDDLVVQEEAFNAQPYLVSRHVEQQLREVKESGGADDK
jgi:hypothetical protein